MSETLIEFEKLPWIEATGVRTKEYVRGDQKIRLVEFSEGFIEEDWCTKGHVGYVLEGSMDIDFNGEVISYTTGDALWIEEGEAEKHKVLIEAGGRVLLVLFEEV